MNKKLLGIILILLGGYLMIGNTALSMLFNYAGPIGFFVPINSVDYWANFSLHGPITIFIAVIGVFLVKYGISILKRDQANIRVTE